MTKVNNLVIRNQNNSLAIYKSELLLGFTKKILSNKIECVSNDDWIQTLYEWADKNSIDDLHIVEKKFNKKSLFTLLVDGESMQPVINHKAVIVADLSQKDLEDDAIYLLYFENKMWVKKYNKKEEIFYSINPLFSHLVYNKEDVHLVAKVLITFTNL